MKPCFTFQAVVMLSHAVKGASNSFSFPTLKQNVTSLGAETSKRKLD